MNITGIIGFIILIILFNVLNRVLQAVVGRKQKPEPPSRREPPPQSPRPRFDERSEDAIVIGDRGSAPIRTVEPDRIPLRESSPYDEAASAEAEAQRTVESWLEEIFEGTAPSRPAPPPRVRKRAEAEPPVDDMTRYTDFERSDGVEAARGERRRFRGAEDRAGAPGEPTRPWFPAPGPGTEHAVVRMLRNPARLRETILAAEILGPCRARIVQRARAPRAVRSVLG